MSGKERFHKIGGNAQGGILVFALFLAGCSAHTPRSLDLPQMIQPEAFGAVGDGIHDDSLSLQKAIDSLGPAGGVIFLPNRYLLDSADLILHENVSLLGRLGTPGNPGENNKAIDAYSRCGGEIILNPDHRIRLKSSSAIRGVRITRKGLVFPANHGSGFAGTAVEVEGEDCYVGYSLILGFHQALHSAGRQRLTIEHLRGDCTNGIWVQDSWDICRVSDCHFWPFTSVAGQGVTREGIAYKFTGVNDGTRITNCFEFGYQIGFELSGCGLSVLNCFADGVADISKPPYTDADTIGFHITGYSRGIRLVSCEAWSKGWGYVFEPETPDLPASLQACKVEQVLNGLKARCNLLMSGCDFRGIKAGIRIGRGVDLLGPSKAQITGSRFYGFDAAIDDANSSATLVEALNIFEECNQNVIK